MVTIIAQTLAPGISMLSPSALALPVQPTTKAAFLTIQWTGNLALALTTPASEGALTKTRPST